MEKFGDGRSPSGKAPAFGAGIRRFESFPPSQFSAQELAAKFAIVLASAVHGGTALIILFYSDI